MSEIGADPDLIEKALLHAKSLTTHAVDVLKLESITPYDRKITYMDGRLDTFDITYVSADDNQLARHLKTMQFGQDILKTGDTTGDRAAIRRTSLFEPTVDDFAIHHREPTISELISEFDAGFDDTPVLHFAANDRYSVDFHTFEPIRPGDPEYSEFRDQRGNLRSHFVETDSATTTARLEQFISLEHKQLYVNAEPQPTPEKLKELHDTMRRSAQQVFKKYGVTAGESIGDTTLNFKVGSPQGVATIKLRYNPYTLAEFGNGIIPYNPHSFITGSPVHSPRVSAIISHNGRIARVAIPFNHYTEAGPITTKLDTPDKRHPLELTSTAELEFVASLLDTLDKNSDKALVKYGTAPQKTGVPVSTQLAGLDLISDQPLPMTVTQFFNVASS